MKRSRIITTGVLLLVLILAAPIAAYIQPATVGADESRIVLTGSMEPTLGPGDVVLVRHATIDNVNVGDIVTFRSHAGHETPYTHRVVDITTDEQGTVLTTKGDANENPDPMYVNEDMLIGTLHVTIPKLGFMINGAQSQITPLILVILSIFTVGHEAQRLSRTKTKPPPRPPTASKSSATPPEEASNT